MSEGRGDSDQARSSGPGEGKEAQPPLSVVTGGGSNATSQSAATSSSHSGLSFRSSLLRSASSGMPRKGSQEHAPSSTSTQDEGTPKLTEGATQGPTPIVQPSGVDEQIESGKTRRQSHGHRRASRSGGPARPDGGAGAGSPSPSSPHEVVGVAGFGLSVRNPTLTAAGGENGKGPFSLSASAARLKSGGGGDLNTSRTVTQLQGLQAMASRQRRGQSKGGFADSSRRLSIKSAAFDAPQRGNGEGQAKTGSRFAVIHPYSSQRQLWDALVIFVLLYNAFVLPYRTALRFDARGRVDGFWVFDRCTDFMFLFDLIFNFFTGHVTREGAVILDQRLIAKRYLKSWFAVDLVSSIPFELILNIGTRTPGAGVSKLLRTVRLARFAKLLRLFRLFRFVSVLSRFEGAFFITYSAATLVKFVLVSSFAMHWAACTFIIVDRSFCTDQSFVEMHDLHGPRDIYVAALYWSFATFMTIGYGDITATCTQTRIMSMFIMLIGSTVWGYGLNFTMTLINQTLLRQHNIVGDRMDSVSRFVQYRKLQPALRAAVQGHFQMVNAGFLSREALINEKQVLSQMTPWLRTEVICSINRHIIKSVPILEKLTRPSMPGGPQLLHKLLYILEAKIFRPDEFVTKEGQLSECIWVLSKGRVEVLKWGKVRVALLEDGAFFGEASFLAHPGCPDWQRRRWASVYSQTYCDVRYISRSKFDAVVASIPELDSQAVYAMLGERHEEVVREQMILQDACLGEYPDVAREFEAEMHSSDEDDDEWDATSPAALSHAATRAPPTPDRGVASNPTSPRDQAVVASAHMYKLHADKELDEDGHVYDAGVWLSPLAEKEKRRFAKIGAAVNTRHMFSGAKMVKSKTRPAKAGDSPGQDVKRSPTSFV